MNIYLGFNGSVSFCSYVINIFNILAGLSRTILQRSIAPPHERTKLKLQSQLSIFSLKLVPKFTFLSRQLCRKLLGNYRTTKYSVQNFHHLWLRTRTIWMLHETSDRLRMGCEIFRAAKDTPVVSSKFRQKRSSLNRDSKWLLFQLILTLWNEPRILVDFSFSWHLSTLTTESPSLMRLHSSCNR